MINISDSVLEYRQYDVGFRTAYTEYEKKGFNILRAGGTEFVIFKTPNWIYLYPRNINDFISLLGAANDEEGFYLVSEAVGKVYFRDFIFGTKKFEGPPSDANHVPFSQIHASSSLTEIIGGQKRVYSPENLMNWNLSQPWVEGSKSNGIGESLRMDLGGMMTANRLIFYSGYFDPTNLDLFYKNTRPRKIEIKTDSGLITSAELKDSPGTQIVELLEYSNNFEIKISSVYPGSAYSDCALCGIFADGETIRY